LVNELVCAVLALQLDLPAATPAIVAVHDDLIQRSREMYVELQVGREPCLPGLSFGSQYPAPEAIIFDTWPRRRLEHLENLNQTAGILAFDIWTGNRDFRQLRFTRPSPVRPYGFFMYDNGDAFGRSDWTFIDKPRLAMNPDVYLYEHIDSISAFEPWLSRI